MAVFGTFSEMASLYEKQLTANQIAPLLDRMFAPLTRPTAISQSNCSIAQSSNWCNLDQPIKLQQQPSKTKQPTNQPIKLLH